MKKWKQYQRIALLILLVLLVILLMPIFRDLTVEEILSYTPKNTLLAVVVILGLYTFKAVICAIPMTVLYISAGVLFPPLWAVVITYIGLTCEIIAGYWFGRYMGSERIMALAQHNAKAAKLMRYLDRHTNMTVTVVRMVPGPLPFDIMSWLFGASQLHFSHYLFYSLLGVSPAMLPWVLAGNAIADPLSWQFLLPFGVGVIVAIALLLLLRKHEKRHIVPTNP